MKSGNLQYLWRLSVVWILMANPEHLAILQQGLGGWNAWRRRHLEIKADLQEAKLDGAKLNSADFSLADLSGAKFCKTDLSLANLGGADLSGANFVSANLCGADLSGAELHQANFSLANLSEAYLNSAHLAKTRLTEANLRRANLSGADLSLADLSGTDLRQANLHQANLSEVDLSGADLRQADLGKANLFRADLSLTDLSGTNLSGADLSGANLCEADLNAARVGYTLFQFVDLSSAIGLDSVHHQGPSTIGIDTLVLSKGNIPDIFLRGAGIPEPFITNMKALIGAMDPIQFYSCFISYSTKDQEFADRLHADLQAKGVRCWFAPHDVQGGRKLHEQIDEAIRLHDKLLLILSPYSMTSEWVKTEISKARKREVRDQARVLFPISLAPFEAIRDWEAFDADTGKDSAREIREYFIPDFSQWKDHDLYRTAFDRLLKDLQASPHPYQ